ncbi:MAG: hypothetical protein ACC645_14780, partial [Pirellulales bacterium]
VVFEADADCVIATELADRVLVGGIEWLDETMLDAQRKWTTTIGDKPIRWATIPAIARQRGLRIRGHFNGQPGLPDAAAARRAILLLKNEFEHLKAVVLIRDADNQRERKDGMDQARRLFQSTTVVVGLAIPEREAWVVCGFEPSDESEEKLLRQERSQLGFDPRLRAHKLTATSDDHAKKSPKRVVSVLTGSSAERERRCWTKTPLVTLRERGQANGLSAYLAEIASKIVPLIAGASKP